MGKSTHSGAKRQRGKAPRKKGTHRAMEDIQESLKDTISVVISMGWAKMMDISCWDG